MTAMYLAGVTAAVSATPGQLFALIVVLAATAGFVVWMVRVARRNRK